MKKNNLSKILHESIRKVLKETDNFYDDEYYQEDEEINGFDEYVNDYPNDDFSKNDIDTTELLSFIKNSGDFLYFFWGRSHAANSQELVDEIYNDVDINGAILTNKIDYALEYQWDKFFPYGDIYVAVFETQDENGEKYQIIYQRDKINDSYS